MIRKILLSVILMLVFITPMSSSAEITDPVLREQILIRIAELQVRILYLQDRLAYLTAIESSRPGQSVLGVSESHEQKQTQKAMKIISYPDVSIAPYAKSRFYDGRYAGLYLTDGYELTVVAGEIDNNVEEVWEIFVEIAGESFVRNHMTEFRIYDDKNSEFDAFTDQIGANNTWILAVNFYNLDLSSRSTHDWLEELLLHEFGHVLFHNSSIVGDFTAAFWNEDDLDHADRVARTTSSDWKDELVEEYYAYHKNDFVSVYAATNPLEDLIESYAFYVIEGSNEGSSEASKKTRFFDAYPYYSSEARRIRKAL